MSFREEHGIAEDVWDARGYLRSERGDSAAVFAGVPGLGDRRTQRTGPGGGIFESAIEWRTSGCSTVDKDGTIRSGGTSGLWMPRFPLPGADWIPPQYRPNLPIVTRFWPEHRHDQTRLDLVRHARESAQDGGHGGEVVPPEKPHVHVRDAGKYLYFRREQPRIGTHPLSPADAPALWIALEGVLKSDALLSATRREGRPNRVVDVGSTTLWHHTDSDLALLALYRDRPARVIPDSDWWDWDRNAGAVWYHVFQFVEHLRALGFSRTAILVPPNPTEGCGHDKHGADDALADGCSLDDFRIIIRPPLEEGLARKTAEQLHEAWRKRRFHQDTLNDAAVVLFDAMQYASPRGLVVISRSRASQRYFGEVAPEWSRDGQVVPGTGTAGYGERAGRAVEELAALGILIQSGKAHQRMGNRRRTVYRLHPAYELPTFSVRQDGSDERQLGGLTSEPARVRLGDPHGLQPVLQYLDGVKQQARRIGLVRGRDGIWRDPAQQQPRRRR